MAEKSSLSSKLSYLASINNGVQDTFNDPFSDTHISSSTEIESSVKNIKQESKDKGKKNKVDRYTRTMEKTSKIINDICDDTSIFDFDNYIENHFTDDEDINFRNNLISLGRKYNRTNSTSTENAEIAKVFSGNERALNELLEELSKDKNALQKDIDTLRLSRTKSYKNLADLISAKNQYYATSLQVIKESHAIKKSQLDLQAKATAKKANEEESSSSASRAISNLFSIGRGNLLSSVGGYEKISGAIEETTNDNNSSRNTYIDDDEEIQRKYFSNNTNESDGDKFLKYENEGVEYILLIHSDDSKEILAEDKNGNIVLDYPMPTNIDDLNFDISDSTNSATDDFHRQYKVRRVEDDD